MGTNSNRLITKFCPNLLSLPFLPFPVDFHVPFDEMETNGQEVLDWAKHTDEILHLFISQNKTLAQVISYMEERHNFKATYYPYCNPSRQIIKLQTNNTTMAERDSINTDSQT
jgi:hypothetical protein